MLMLWSIPVGGLSYSAYEKVRDYLLKCYHDLEAEEIEGIEADDDAQNIAKKVVSTLGLIPENEPGRRDAFEEMYGFVCKACPDLGKQDDQEAAEESKGKVRKDRDGS